MKKHKVKIPDGYEVESDNVTGNIHGTKFITITCKPIKKELPKTWEEYYVYKERQMANDIIVPTRYAKEFEALAKLVELRDYYNDGWEPDWEDTKQDKYIINFMNQGMRVLTFKTFELEQKFFKNFRDLIETAKPLL